MSMIRENLEGVRQKIKIAAEKSGRSPEDIKLVAVTKFAEVDQIREAINCGVDCIGENIVQSAEEKFSKLPFVEKHMVGHLQTNKAKLAVGLFDMFQSIDSMKIAREVNKRALDAGKVMPVLFEINIGNEETKNGIMLEDAPSFYDKLLGFINLRVQGIMCIAPFVAPEKTRVYFRRMHELYRQLGLRYLSMGMTNDYEVAIEEGSNMVRIGRAIFQE